MSRQPKLRPKTHIPGLSENWYDLATIAKLKELEYGQGTAEDRREQRVFRVKRKHVLKACDRCRVKKTKCDGKQPCNRCSTYNHPCLFRERKATQTKVYSRGFVEMLESHHSLVVKALQQLYKRCINKEGFPGEPLAEGADGYPLTHTILDRLGLIKQAEENPDEPEEESEDLQYLKLLSTSTESSATTEPSPEPVTPPEPSSTNCSPVDPPLGSSSEPFKWDMQMLPSYNNYSNPAYHNGMMMSRPLLATNLAESNMSSCITADSGPGQGTSAGAASAPYLYYTNKDPRSSQIHPPLMIGLESDPHRQAAAGLPVDIMFNECHLALQGQQQQQQEQQQQQALYAPFARGWSYTSG